MEEIGVFEIKEFIDDKGNVTGSDVIDLQKQLKGYRSIIEEMVTTEENEEKKKAASELIEKLEKTTSINAGISSEPLSVCFFCAIKLFSDTIFSLG